MNDENEIFKTKFEKFLNEINNQKDDINKDFERKHKRSLTYQRLNKEKSLDLSKFLKNDNDLKYENKDNSITLNDVIENNEITNIDPDSNKKEIIDNHIKLIISNLNIKNS